MLSANCVRMKMLKYVACTTAKVEIMSLGGKTRYIIYSRTLKRYLEIGVELNAVQRVLSFRQHAYLKPRIDFNTATPKVDQNTFEKIFYKLMDNEPYGKSLKTFIRVYISTWSQTNVNLWNSQPALVCYISSRTTRIWLVFQWKKRPINLNRPL